VLTKKGFVSEKYFLVSASKKESDQKGTNDPSTLGGGVNFSRREEKLKASAEKVR